jgi:hypothetical protein
MLRLTIDADERTDTDAEVERLRRSCSSARLDAAMTELLVAQTRAVLSQLVEHGKEVAAVGSQMRVSRELNGEGYSIKINFGPAASKSFFSRVASAIRGS